MTPSAPHHYFSDDQNPHDPEQSAAQVQGLQNLLQPLPQRVLDLGCGHGRILLPLLNAGCDVIGMDHDPQVLTQCSMKAKERGLIATLHEGDFQCDTPLGQPDSFDAVCLLGNTIMTVVEMEDAAALFRRIQEMLRPGGKLIIDDCPQDLWPELTDGHWQSGLSEDGSLQMVWDEADAIFALRSGDEVDSESWAIKSSDKRRRLWTMGDLRLLALLSGLSAPEHLPEAAVLVMQRPDA